MSLQVKVGSFSQRAGTGTQAITGLGFQPKGLIFWGNSVGGLFTRSGAFDWRIGLSDGINNISHTANCGNLLGAVEAAETGISSSSCFISVSIAAGPFFGATLLSYGIVDSLDADGFTANFQFNFNNLCQGHTWNYIAIGGAGVSVKVDKFIYAASGTFTVTGLSFEPTALIGYRSSEVAGPLNGTGGSAGLGFAASCELVQCMFTGRTADIRNPSIVKSYQKNTKFSASIDFTGGVIGESNVTAFTSDGFTIAYTGGATLAQHYMAIGGVSANAGVITQPLTSGVVSTGIQAQSPKAVLIAGYGKPTSSVPVGDQLFSFGASDLTGNSNAWCGDLDNISAPTFRQNKTIDLTRFLTQSTVTGEAGSFVNTQAQLDSVGPLNFDINWTLVDGEAKEWFYLVLADDLGTGACGSPQSNTGAGIYKQIIGNIDDEIYI